MHCFIAILATATGAIIHSVSLIHLELEAGARKFHWVFGGFLGIVGIVVKWITSDYL
jgi:hypothetical protein